MCPDFWTIIDPLHSFTSPTHSMTNNISTAIATTYLHHNLPVPPLPPFRRVNRIAIQNDLPLAAWSCGTIAVLTTLHLTLGQIRPDKININTDNITRRHILNFHQALLQWLILGTPPDLWNLNCINKDIIRCEPIRFPEAHTRCGLMQSLLLPRGSNTIPRNSQTQHTPTLGEHSTRNTAPKRETTPALPVIPRAKNKPPTSSHHNNPITPTTEPTIPPFTRHPKHYPILSHQERKTRIATARRRGTAREKLHHATNQHPLSDYWPNITPQSLPIALHPPTPTPTHTSHNIHSIGLKNVLPVNITPLATPSPPDNTATPTMEGDQLDPPTPHAATSTTTSHAQLKTIEQTTHLQTINGETPPPIPKSIITLITQNTQKTGRHSPSNTDIIALLNSHKPDILFLTETPTDKDGDALRGILSNKGYHIHYHPDNTPSSMDDTLPESRLPTSITNSRGGCMIAHTKSATWAISLRPFSLPKHFPRQLACALEGTLDTGHNCLLITCYLPQDLAKHAEACVALSTLTTSYPNHLIILGGDF